MWGRLVAHSALTRRRHLSVTFHLSESCTINVSSISLSSSDSIYKLCNSCYILLEYVSTSCFVEFTYVCAYFNFATLNDWICSSNVKFMLIYIYIGYKWLKRPSQIIITLFFQHNYHINLYVKFISISFTGIF